MHGSGARKEGSRSMRDVGERVSMVEKGNRARLGFEWTSGLVSGRELPTRILLSKRFPLHNAAYSHLISKRVIT